MTAAERVTSAIRFRCPDRVPAGLFGTWKDYEQGLAEHMGCKTIEAMYDTLEVDVWHTGGIRYAGTGVQYRGKVVDAVGGLYSEHNPEPPFRDMADVAEVEEFPFPGMDAFDTSDLEHEVRTHTDFALCTGINAAIFHNFLYMRGQMDGLCLIKANPELAAAMVRRITDYWVEFLERTLEVVAGRAVMVENCNDFGTQRSLFISVDAFRSIFKPQLARLVEMAHRHGIAYMQHSCGAIRPLIDDYIDMGADLLNPIQTMADGMDLAGVQRDYGGRIALYGGIDTQQLLPNGPVADIRRAVVEAVAATGGKGGLILSGSQGLMNDIPYSHAAAMLDPVLRA
jgi:uroporphyrinogen decarboxylase